MQLNILKTKFVVSIFVICVLSSCDNKSNLDTQITIKITSVNNKTKQPRINTYDTIVVRKEENGYLTKSYKKIGEYVTDSTGSVTIKIDCTKGYKFLLNKKGFYGSENFSKPFTKEKLKNNQEVNIEVIPLEN